MDDAKKKIRSHSNWKPNRSAKRSAGDLNRFGLNKLNRTSELEDTPAVRGMVNKVKHLVRVKTREAAQLRRRQE